MNKERLTPEQFSIQGSPGRDVIRDFRMDPETCLIEVDEHGTLSIEPPAGESHKSRPTSLLCMTGHWTREPTE